MPARVILAALLALAGCADKGKPGEEMIGEMTKLRDELCRCADRACADDVDRRRAELSNAAKTRYGELKNLPKEVVNRLVVIDGEMRTCRDQLPQ